MIVLNPLSPCTLFLGLLGAVIVVNNDVVVVCRCYLAIRQHVESHFGADDMHVGPSEMARYKRCAFIHRLSIRFLHPTQVVPSYRSL